MNKVLVIGVSCSGKTTFGRRLAKLLGVNFYDLDDLYWFPGWIESNPLEFSEKVSKLLGQDRWVFVGNYKSVQKMLIESSDTVIWLDYSKSLVWIQALNRCFNRIILRTSCCNGNYESFFRTFFSRDSILLWIFKDYTRRKRKYNLMLESGEFDGKTFVHLKRRSDAEEFFKVIDIV
ncbi:shikimate kinase [Halobacteriovorax sp. JY17]|uniref:shikimate kinase n=1 Tax=Halobacteriovorax sp. JY17 TaxID=2014617 RepID=UPI000C48086C|nr:shikimate kinase [Halobacteriovorax sp. JY17]PIK15136.1 MAG: hypothetical protein CES88_00055 [Halobacteriovorax sp. JY17]